MKYKEGWVLQDNLFVRDEGILVGGERGGMIGSVKAREKQELADQKHKKRKQEEHGGLVDWGDEDDENEWGISYDDDSSSKQYYKLLLANKALLDSLPSKICIQSKGIWNGAVSLQSIIVKTNTLIESLTNLEGLGWELEKEVGEDGFVFLDNVLRNELEAEARINYTTGVATGTANLDIDHANRRSPLLPQDGRFDKSESTSLTLHEGNIPSERPRVVLGQPVDTFKPVSNID